MNNDTQKSFYDELEKLASNPIVGAALTAGFTGKLVANLAQQIKGMKEARNAGATFKEMFKANALPLGKDWKFKPLKDTERKFKIDTSNVSTPYDVQDPYEFHMDKQKDFAQTVGTPIGLLGSVVTIKNLSDNKRNKGMLKAAAQKSENISMAAQLALTGGGYASVKINKAKGKTPTFLARGVEKDSSKMFGKTVGKFMGRLSKIENTHPNKYYAASAVTIAIPLAVGLLKKKQTAEDMGKQDKQSWQNVLNAPYNIGRRIKYNIS